MTPPPQRPPGAIKGTPISADEDETGERTMVVSGPPFAAGASARGAPPPPARERPPVARVPPARPEKAWRPYQFQNLIKLTRSQVLLARRVEWLLPSVTGAGRVREGVLARLHELLEEQVGLVVDSLVVVKARDLRKFFTQASAFGVLSPLPQKTRGVVEVELPLAHALIDKLLGGAGEQLGIRPLTDIEEGVMAYILLEVLKSLAPYIEPGLPRLRLEAMVKTPEDALRLFAEEPEVAVVQFKATMGALSGYVRMFIPQAVLALVTPPTEDRKGRRAAEAKQHLGRLAGVRTWLRAEIGRAEISSRELENLRVKDVVLVEGITARPDRKEGGTARIRIGRGKVGWIDAQIVVEKGRYRARLGELHLGEEARAPEHVAEEEAPVEEEEQQGGEGAQSGSEEENEESSGDSSDLHTDPAVRSAERDAVAGEQGAEGSELLNDIPLQLAVELGRIAVSAEDVVSMRVGQVVELNRVPGEPVELSVNGKLVARGEIVEVEGHLGVRITALAG